ncbi:MAG: hypothetical protein SGJ04_01380 [Bacteroidota bacterium]|nr:hypothetical protein [Bacteroidota bacterium]
MSKLNFLKSLYQENIYQIDIPDAKQDNTETGVSQNIETTNLRLEIEENKNLPEPQYVNLINNSQVLILFNELPKESELKSLLISILLNTKTDKSLRQFATKKDNPNHTLNNWSLHYTGPNIIAFGIDDSEMPLHSLVLINGKKILRLNSLSSILTDNNLLNETILAVQSAYK